MPRIHPDRHFFRVTQAASRMMRFSGALLAAIGELIGMARARPAIRASSSGSMVPEWRGPAGSKRGVEGKSAPQKFATLSWSSLRMGGDRLYAVSPPTRRSVGKTDNICGDGRSARGRAGGVVGIARDSGAVPAHCG